MHQTSSSDARVQTRSAGRLAPHSKETIRFFAHPSNSPNEAGCIIGRKIFLTVPMTEPESAEALDELMREYQGGSLTAFEALYRALAPRLRGFIRAKVRDEGRASDLLQEAFLEIHRSRHTYLPGNSVASWAFGITQNVMLRHRRGERRRHRREVPIDSWEFESQPASGAAHLELHSLQDALQQLSPDSRATWWMRNIEGLSFDAIARKLGIAATAVRLRCSRASRAVRAALERGPDND
jgi:RNA polymerase sigma-70 factor (ECF subfamily)